MAAAGPGTRLIIHPGSGWERQHVITRERSIENITEKNKWQAQLPMRLVTSSRHLQADYLIHELTPNYHTNQETVFEFGQYGADHNVHVTEHHGGRFTIPFQP